MLEAAAAVLFFLAVVSPVVSSQSYNAIFSFGDSISDTGNLCTSGCPSWLTTGQPPYGNTYFRRPTGRCTDGRVVIDFLADHFGLPMLPPSKASGGDFKKGANMAIIGATTMNFDFFQKHGLGNSIWNNGPLGTQIQWFQQLTPSICGTDSDCKSYFNSSLFIVGEFGGNDYNAPIFSGKVSMAEIRTWVPQIIDTIASGVETLIGLGAVEVVVPGVLPIGCFPLYLTLYPSSNKDDYDEIGCLKSFNDLSSYHNELLKTAVSRLQTKYPGVRLMYADFYAQVADMVRSPDKFGLKYGLKVCCGAGGQGSYNYNNGKRCGMPESSACDDPENYLVWDGIHLTDAAYNAIADGWLDGTYCSPGNPALNKLPLIIG
ncbi:hypothetical protein PR202_ga24159 [Eleusine coracana subsp. coracana]|uniref:GDSL esterase/lipase n=1 Tax=Eleusine coracana subsp. coracana TaxID=191504 RepID=A0AAV5D8Q8_ELECO|nr:hypothetical protein QOZ80_1BG0050490 [Eleusine coracana subsp. coracana]GJN06430.1 hypothetical protein PR202_ga24159 [Eleusine coracana subsp. coracana]